MAFNAAGDLFAVRGSGNTTTVFIVTAADFAAANGGNIPSSQSASVTTTADVNGVAFDAAGKAYLGSSTQLRSYNMPNWSDSTTVVSAGLNSTDLATCSSPPTITIEKYVEGGRVNPGDQFKLTLHQGNTLLGDAKTTGTAPGLQDKRVGPLPTVRNVQLKFAETAAGTGNLNQYASSYQCLVDGVLDPAASGDGTSGTITIPTGGENVVCQFHNSPLIARAVVHKDVVEVDGTTGPRSGWTVGLMTTATSGQATQDPVATSRQTDGNGNAAWDIKFGSASGRAKLTVSEQMQDRHEFQSGSCTITQLNGSTRVVDLPSPAATDLVEVRPGDRVECSYTNKQKPGAVKWNKVAAESGAPLGGSEWTVTGPGFPAPGATIQDCESDPCTGLDQDPAKGAFKLEGLAWGTYTVKETLAPEGYDGDAEFTFTVGQANAGTTIEKGDFENYRKVASAAWLKTDDFDDSPLAGSEWTLAGPGVPADTVITDCTAQGACGSGPYDDQDPAPGKFLLVDLPFGTYKLTEVGVPDGYEGAGELSFTVDKNNAGTTIPVGTVANQRIPGEVTWTKVDQAGGYLAGSEWALTPTGGTAIPVEDCVAATAAECTSGPDKDNRAGRFKLQGLAWGEYTLIETKAPPGFVLGDFETVFTVSADQQSFNFGPFENTQQAGPTLPLTGGFGRDHVYLAGAAVLLLAGGAFGAKRIRARHTGK